MANAMRAMITALFVIAVLAPSTSFSQSKKDWRDRAQRSEREHAALLSTLRAIEMTPEDLDALQGSRDRVEELEAELERERKARLDAEADEAEALEVAKEALRRNAGPQLADERRPLSYADSRGMGGSYGSPTQVIPSSEAVMYVDKMPAGFTTEDVIRVGCYGPSTCRSWILVILGNELPSVPMDGQHPFPQRVRIGDAEASFHLLPPGSMGYIVPDKMSYDVIRIVTFEGSPLSEQGLRMSGVYAIRGNRAENPHGKCLSDVGATNRGGVFEAVAALLLRIAPLRFTPVS